MDFELQRANAVRDALDIVAQTMGEIIHRINAPCVSGMMVLRVTNAVENRVTQPNVRRGHVDLRLQRARAVREFTGLHSREKVETFFNRTIAERTFLAGMIG